MNVLLYTSPIVVFIILYLKVAHIHCNCESFALFPVSIEFGFCIKYAYSIKMDFIKKY